MKLSRQAKGYLESSLSKLAECMKHNKQLSIEEVRSDKPIQIIHAQQTNYYYEISTRCFNCRTKYRIACTP